MAVAPQSPHDPLEELLTQVEIPAVLPDAMQPRRTVGAAGYDGGKAIEKIGFQHDMIIDAMLRQPRIQQKELAVMFGYSPGWMNRLVNSDSFQARIAERKAQLIDPGIARRLNARVAGVALQAVDVLSRKLDATESADLALEALGITASVVTRKAQSE